MSDAPSLRAELGAAAVEAAGGHVAAKLAGRAASATVAHWGMRGAARLIPGLGEIAIAYDATVFGYEAITGRDWSSTAVGGAVDRATSATAGAALDATSGLVRAAGFGAAADFIGGDLRFAMTGKDGTPAEPPADGPAGSAAAFARPTLRVATIADLPTPSPGRPAARDDLDVLNGLGFQEREPGRRVSLDEATKLCDQQENAPDGALAGRSRGRVVGAAMAADASETRLQSLAGVTKDASAALRPNRAREADDGRSL